MSQRVLSVGQCGMDHGSISRLIEDQFDAQVTSAASARQANELLRSGSFQLVLVNRIFDADGDSGLDWIKQARQDSSLASIPMMLVSNFPEAQQQAVAAGALAGFGKSELHSRETAKKLAAILE